MNAIIGLCHFCEAHGPRPVFATFTTDNESHTIESSNTSTHCSGCRSLGPETVLLSRDADGTIYCSRESVPNADVTSFLRQAAIRSITCEISWSKEGGIVYFSDNRGHVLSFNFQLKDTKSRGLKRWFSIVVLMKDKMLLLNITPLLSEHMKKIAKELQDYAEKVYEAEQQVCSQRSLRLNTGSNYFGQSRSLTQLTGEEEVFKKLHSHFTWMLKAGALNFTETLYTSADLLQKFKVQNSKSLSIFTPNVCNLSTDNECISLRDLEKLLKQSIFKIILYCSLIGVEIVVKTRITPGTVLVKSISRVLPLSDTNYVANITVANENVASSCKRCVLEEIAENDYSWSWLGSLPNKCPTLMTRIESAISNTHFDDEVLHQHIKALQLEWLGIARAVKSTIDATSAKSESVKKLKQVLGVSPHDEILLNYWISAFCT